MIRNALCGCLALSVGLCSAHAAIVQRVEVVSELDPFLSPDPFEDISIQEISGTTSADITQATLGSISGSRTDPQFGVANYTATRLDRTIRLCRFGCNTEWRHFRE